MYTNRSDLAGGAMATFEAPGAGNGTGQGTNAEGIDVKGDIVGYYVDASNVNHGFLLTP
jgi:hypothetical protein